MDNQTLAKIVHILSRALADIEHEIRLEGVAPHLAAENGACCEAHRKYIAESVAVNNRFVERRNRALDARKENDGR